MMHALNQKQHRIIENMVSVADVLELDLMAGAQVVAGTNGLQVQVSWVHNAGVPDAAYWLNGGELVLTTMINLPEDTQAQCRYLEDMVEKNVAALAITVGRYIEHIPAHLCEVAEAHDFPLIEIPYQARFVDIAKAVNERIAQQSLHMVQRAMDIQATLTQIVLHGGGDLQTLAEKLADLLGHSISIETAEFEAMATHNLAAVDEARRYTQMHGRTNPALVQALEDEGYLPGIRESLQPAHLPPLAHVGLEMERVLAPIVVHGEIYGFFWIIADVHEISRLDMMAIESGATVAALIMLYQESVQNAEASLKGSLLAQLIQGDTHQETILNDRSLRYGVDLRLPYFMLLLEVNSSTPGSLFQVYRSLNALITSEGWQAVAGQFAGAIVVLLQAQSHTEAQSLVKQIMARHANMLRIGISSQQQGAEQVRVSYQQTIDVMTIMQRLSPDETALYFDDLGYLHALYHAGRESLDQNPAVPVLRQLLDETQADLFRTLEAYLDAGGNGVSTAETLHIHRSTLNYRLSRITQLCDVDLQNPSVRMDLLVALKLMRLFDRNADTHDNA